MIDKQSEQLSDVTREKERYKRDLEHVKVILNIKMVMYLMIMPYRKFTRAP